MNQQFKIFLISGLGANERTFDFLELDFQDRVEHISWIPPLKKEKIESYCTRLIETYKIDKQSVLVGLSFGGVIAVEVSKQVNPLKTIIISSVRNKYDLSRIFRLTGKLKLYKLISEKRIKKSNVYTERGFGAVTDQEKKLLATVLANTDVEVAKWAMGEMTTWNERGKNEHIIRIHGNKDKILPLKNKADYTIDDGGHMMITQRAPEISEILNKEISQL